MAKPLARWFLARFADSRRYSCHATAMGTPFRRIWSTIAPICGMFVLLLTGGLISFSRLAVQGSRPRPATGVHRLPAGRRGARPNRNRRGAQDRGQGGDAWQAQPHHHPHRRQRPRLCYRRVPDRQGPAGGARRGPQRRRRRPCRSARRHGDAGRLPPGHRAGHAADRLHRRLRPARRGGAQPGSSTTTPRPAFGAGGPATSPASAASTTRWRSPSDQRDSPPSA